MDVVPLEFDAPAYQHINQAREVWLRRIFGQLPFRGELQTALDIGCGAGHFSQVLHELGLSVTGLDLREENLAVCRSRFPHIAFDSIDLDEDFTMPRHDLVLLFGILYHLQSPLTALPRLGDAVGRVAVVSTRVAAGHEMTLHLFRENHGLAHNEASVTAVPTFPALVALFHLAGLDHVYLPDEQPYHPEWHVSADTPGKRVSFLAAREPLPVTGWRRLSAAAIPRKWTVTSWWTRLRHRFLHWG
jgi:SAM-dependent methyltransferase